MSSVHGIGVDLVDVGRIRQSIEEFGERFLHRVFTESERTYCDARARRFEHYAGRFAAKEAVLKALGTGWNHQTHFLEVEIIPAASGATEPFDQNTVSSSSPRTPGTNTFGPNNGPTEPRRA